MYFYITKITCMIEGIMDSFLIEFIKVTTHMAINHINDYTC